MATMRPSLQGLNALLPNVNDPLGTNLKRRGMDAYYEEARKSDPRYASGPLPDPAWEGMFQALADRGVTRVGQDVERPHGIADSSDFDTSGDVGALHRPVDANSLTTQDIENQHLMKSTNLATPASLQGLLKARKR